MKEEGERIREERTKGEKSTLKKPKRRLSIEQLVLTKGEPGLYRILPASGKLQRTKAVWSTGVDFSKCDFRRDVFMGWRFQ